MIQIILICSTKHEKSQSGQIEWYSVQTYAQQSYKQGALSYIYRTCDFFLLSFYHLHLHTLTFRVKRSENSIYNKFTVASERRRERDCMLYGKFLLPRENVREKKWALGIRPFCHSLWAFIVDYRWWIFIMIANIHKKIKVLFWFIFDFIVGHFTGYWSIGRQVEWTTKRMYPFFSVVKPVFASAIVNDKSLINPHDTQLFMNKSRKIEDFVECFYNWQREKNICLYTQFKRNQPNEFLSIIIFPKQFKVNGMSNLPMEQIIETECMCTCDMTKAKYQSKETRISTMRTFYGKIGEWELLFPPIFLPIKNYSTFRRIKWKVSSKFPQMGHP